jgi:hypothetical protein
VTGDRATNDLHALDAVVVKQRQNNDRLRGATLEVLRHSGLGGTLRLRARPDGSY